MGTAGENKTSSYVQAVANELGVKPGDMLNVRDPETLTRLTSAIIRHENGAQPYPADTLRAGVELAISGGSSKKSPAEFLAAMPRAKALSELDRQIETRLADKLARTTRRPWPNTTRCRMPRRQGAQRRHRARAVARLRHQQGIPRPAVAGRA